MIHAYTNNFSLISNISRYFLSIFACFKMKICQQPIRKMSRFPVVHSRGEAITITGCNTYTTITKILQLSKNIFITCANNHLYQLKVQMLSNINKRKVFQVIRLYWGKVKTFPTCVTSIWWVQFAEQVISKYKSTKFDSYKDCCRLAVNLVSSEGLSENNDTSKLEFTIIN